MSIQKIRSCVSETTHSWVKGAVRGDDDTIVVYVPDQDEKKEC